MRDRLGDFGDAEIVVVTFTATRNLAGYRRFVDPLTVVADESRTLYREFAFGRGSWWRVWGFRTIRRYIALFRSGEANVGGRHIVIDGDTLQLGGDVVVTRDGRVSWVFRGSGPDDRPTVDELVEQVRRCG